MFKEEGEKSLNLMIPILLCVRPVILLPPLYGSNLYASYSENEFKDDDCPKSAHDLGLWINMLYMIKPKLNCLIKLMKVHWDENTQTAASAPNVSIYARDFEGTSSILFADLGIIGVHLYEIFNGLINLLISKKYVVKKSLFGAPYDWRMAIMGLGDYFEKLKSLVMKAYKLNGNTKVAMVGYSCGGFLLQHFLTEKVDQDWKDKYIDSAIFLAPSFGGSIGSVTTLWERKTSAIPYASVDLAGDLVESFPVIYQHFPNHEIFGDRPLVVTPSGDSFNASNVSEFLISHNRINGDNIKFLDFAKTISRNPPKKPGVPTMIIYNSGISTPSSMIFESSLSDIPSIQYSPGDGQVETIGPKWACNNWNADDYHPIYCIEINQSSDSFRHDKLSKNPYVKELLVDAIMNNKWKSKGVRTYVRAPLVQIEKDTFRIRHDLRRTSISITK